MNSLDHAREIIANALGGVRFPIVLWSGGKDSQLVLKLVNDVVETPALWFRSVDPKRNRFAEQFIANSGITAYSWGPSNRYVLPNGEGLSLAEEFSFGRRTLPVISDIVPGERCVVNLPKQRVAYVNYDFDVTFAGTKRSDVHPLAKAPEGFIFPLWEMSDAEVWEAIREMEIPIEESVYNDQEPDGPSLCTRCLTPGSDEVFCPDAQRMIPRFVWDSNAALAAFNSRFSQKAA